MKKEHLDFYQAYKTKTQENQTRINQKQVEYNSLPMRPLKIAFQMSLPYSCLDPFHLDSLLAFFSLQEMLGECFYTNDDSQVIHAPLPLARTVVNQEKDIWFWHASAGISEVLYEEIASWKKRWDDENDDLVQEKRGGSLKIDHKRSFFKSYSMPLVITGSKSIHFYVVGNEQEIRKLLSNCTHIGKKRSQGYGEVKKIEIHDTNDNYSCWIADKPMRAMPAHNVDVSKFPMLQRMGYRPPYWHPINMALCYSLK